MISQEKIVHIDGVDKTGKDTLRDKLIKTSEGKLLIYVRSFLSQIVYNRLYKRNIDENFFWNKFVKEYNNSSVFIVLTCSQDVARQRFIDNDEKDLDIEDYNKHLAMFNQVCIEAKSRGIIIYTFDTSHETPEQILSKMTHAINSHYTFD